MVKTGHDSGLQKRRPSVPGEKVEIIEGPLKGIVGTVIKHDETHGVLLWLERGTYARVHELFLNRIKRRW